MRLLLPCHTRAPIDRTQVLAALAPLGWLPADDNKQFTSAKSAAVLAELPADVRDEIVGTDPILIEPTAGTWGLCSLEKQNTVSFRVLHRDPAELQQVARRIVEAFAPSLEKLADTQVDFPESIQIRKVDNQEPVGSGIIQRRPELQLRQYVRNYRGREAKVMATLLSVFITCAVASVLIFTLGSGTRVQDYVRGWTDRLGSAFLVALLTTAVTLTFEYRTWRSRGDSIAWSFGEVHYLPPP
jgi:hypothetical protein